MTIAAESMVERRDEGRRWRRVRRARGVWLACALVAVCGCQADTVDIDGLPCGDDPCVDGYSCHPETAACVPTVSVGCAGGDAICPSSLTTGDACPSAGSFIPCADGFTDCSQGCRTCQEDSTWGACSVEACPECGGVCTTFYADVDGDGYGNAAAPTAACTAPQGTVTNSDDCDDARQHCGLDCTDVDGDDFCGANDCDDALPNCDIDCTDVDGDEFCGAHDCDDNLPHCDIDCTDVDQDDYCGANDCNDDNDVCTTDCTACTVTAPTSLTLTVTTAGAINPGTTVDLAIALAGATADESAALACTASRQTIWGPVDFSRALTEDNLSLDYGDLAVADAAPFDVGTCSGQGAFVSVVGRNPSATLESTAAIDAAGFGELQLGFVAATASADTGDELEARACCGAACTRAAAGSVLQPDISGANACAVQSVTLPQTDCAELNFSLVWLRGAAALGLDDLELTGASIVADPVRVSDTSYTTSFVAGPAGTVDITCEWNGGQLSDTKPVTISP